MKKILANIKYRFVREAATDFFQAVPPDHLEKLIKFSKNTPSTLFQPVPLHPDRLRKRGFNQSEILTRFFQQYLSYDMVSAVERIKNINTQARLLTHRDRYRNVQGAFQITSSEIIKGKTVIIVDDVVTSGSTVREVGRILKRAGAQRVFVFSLARG